ncbi:MAG: GntR family transcriptional regulator [Rhodobacteraceae bacterium]|nr:GntR family transcriptional regulator [Paracoccaceae bacterium]
MNELHRNLSERILRHIRTADLPEGAHLTEQSLQALLGTSRQPIRSALAHLETRGVLERIPNKGFFLRDPSAVDVEELQPGNGQSDEAIYLRIAEEKLARILPDKVSENDLMRRYNISRLQLRRILTRIAGEGWIERNEGRGWTFASLIDSLEAYRESYDLRRMLEPQGLRSADFRLDVKLLSGLRRQQELLRDGGWKTLGQMDLFETNSAFHEGLAQMSGNRFLHSTIARMNQLRRLVEYRQTLDRDRVRSQNAEHLEIIDALEAEEVETAAELLEAHIGGAKARKANAEIF